MRGRAARFRFILILANVLIHYDVRRIRGETEAPAVDDGLRSDPPEANDNPEMVEDQEGEPEREPESLLKDGEPPTGFSTEHRNKPKVIERYDLQKVNSTLSEILTVLTNLINVYNSATVFQPIATGQLYNNNMLTQSALKNTFKLARQKCAQLGGYLFAPTDYLATIQNIQRLHGLDPETDFFWVNVDQDSRTDEIIYPVTRGLFPKRWASGTDAATYDFNETHCYVLNTAGATAAAARLQAQSCTQTATVICQFDYEAQKERLQALQNSMLEDMKMQKASLEDFQNYLDEVEPDGDCNLAVGRGAQVIDMFHLEKPLQTLKSESAAGGTTKAGKIVHLINLFLDDLRLLHQFKLRLKRSIVSTSEDADFLCVHEPVVAITRNDIGKTLLDQLKILTEHDSGPFPRWIGTMILIAVASATLVLALLTFCLGLICNQQCIRDNRCSECRRPLKSNLRRGQLQVAFKNLEEKPEPDNQPEKQKRAIRNILAFWRKSKPEAEAEEEVPEPETPIIKDQTRNKKVMWQVSPDDQVTIECAEHEVQPLLDQIRKVTTRSRRKLSNKRSESKEHYPELDALLSVIDNPKPSAPQDPELPPYRSSDKKHSDSDASCGSIHPFSGVETLNKMCKT